MKKTLTGKALWLTGFVAEFMLIFVGLELLWNKFISGTGFTINAQKLPGEAVSALVIGLLILYFGKSKNTENKPA